MGLSHSLRCVAIVSAHGRLRPATFLHIGKEFCPLPCFLFFLLLQYLLVRLLLLFLLLLYFPLLLLQALLSLSLLLNVLLQNIGSLLLQLFHLLSAHISILVFLSPFLVLYHLDGALGRLRGELLLLLLLTIDFHGRRGLVRVIAKGSVALLRRLSLAYDHRLSAPPHLLSVLLERLKFGKHIVSDANRVNILLNLLRSWSSCHWLLPLLTRGGRWSRASGLLEGHVAVRVGLARGVLRFNGHRSI